MPYELRAELLFVRMLLAWCIVNSTTLLSVKIVIGTLAVMWAWQAIMLLTRGSNND